VEKTLVEFMKNTSNTNMWREYAKNVTALGRCYFISSSLIRFIVLFPFFFLYFFGLFSLALRRKQRQMRTKESSRRRKNKWIIFFFVVYIQYVLIPMDALSRVPSGLYPIVVVFIEQMIMKFESSFTICICREKCWLFLIFPRQKSLLLCNIVWFCLFISTY
jgi:hypothetical protein